MQFASQAMDKLQDAAGFGFDDRLHHQLATVTEDSDHNRFLVHVHSDIFDVTTHLSCLLGGKLIRANVYLSPKVKMSSFRAALLEADVNHPDSGRAANATRSFNRLKRAFFHNALAHRGGFY
jgi:hypothetical protein